jgi:predicted amidohydrolase
MPAVVQFRPERGRRAENLAALARLTEGPLARGHRLVVLPEMAATGYRFPDAAAVRPLAEPAEGPTLATFAPLAERYQAWIVVGFAEADGDRLFNSALVIDPQGRRFATYRKRLLYTDDFTWAQAGDLPYPRFTTPDGTATVGICMDVNGAEFPAHLRKTQPDVVCFPTNWIDQALRHRPVLGVAVARLVGPVPGRGPMGQRGRRGLLRPFGHPPGR